MEMCRVEGIDHGEIKLFTLSTCIWCKKLKALLKEMDVGYWYADVDELEGVDREEALNDLKRFNPQCSFPCLVVNDSLCIVGYNEARVREALKL